MPSKDKSIVTAGRRLVARASGEGAWGARADACAGLFGGDDNVLELDGGGGRMTLRLYEIPQSCSLQNGQFRQNKETVKRSVVGGQGGQGERDEQVGSTEAALSSESVA